MKPHWWRCNKEYGQLFGSPVLCILQRCHRGEHVYEIEETALRYLLGLVPR